MSDTLHSLSLTLPQVVALEQKTNLLFANAVADAFAAVLASSPTLKEDTAIVGLRRMQVAMAGQVMDLAVPWESARRWLHRARAWNRGDGICTGLISVSTLDILKNLVSAPLEDEFADAASAFNSEREGIELAIATAVTGDGVAPNQLGPKVKC